MASQGILRLNRNVVIYGIGGVLGRFIWMLLLPVFTAYLTPADYGVYGVLTIVGFIATPLFSLGFGASMAPCYYQEAGREHKRETVWTAFSILCVSCCVLSLSTLGFAPQISQALFQTQEYQYVLRVFLLGTALSILSLPFTLYMQFEERAVSFVLLTAAATLASAGLSFFMVVVLKRGLRGFIEGGFLGQLGTLSIFLISVVSRLGFRFSAVKGKELLRLGIPLVPSFAFIFVLQDANKYILKWMDSLEALGIYTIGFNLGLVMALLAAAFQRAWVPFFMSFKDKREEAEVLFGRVMTYYVFGFGSISLLFFFAARPVTMILTQPAFHEAYKVVGLSAFAQFLVGVFSILLPGIYFSREVKFISLLQGAAAFIGTGFSFLLIRLFGFVGAGMGLVIGFAVLVCLTHLWNLFRRATYLNVRYEWNRLISFLLVYGVYSLISCWDRNMSLIGESLFLLAVLSTLPVTMLALLNKTERAWVREHAVLLVHGMTFDSISKGLRVFRDSRRKQEKN